MKTFVVWLASNEIEREEYLNENEQEDTGQPLMILDSEQDSIFGMVQAESLQVAIKYFNDENQIRNGSVRAFEVTSDTHISTFKVETISKLSEI